MPKTYTVKEVAEILGFSTNSIYAFLKAKRIKGVRVGKGRFRIPEEELARILHLSQSSGAPQSKTPVMSPTSGAEVPREGTEPAGAAAAITSGLERLTKKAGIAEPNLFDWFIGVSSLVSGAGLFLFNQTGVEVGGAVMPFLTATRVVLIALGLGIIICNVFDRLQMWRRIFYGMLTLLSCISVWSMLRIADYDGAAIYGVMGMTVLLNSLGLLSGTESLAWLLGLLLTLVVLLIAVGVNVAHVQILLGVIHLTNGEAALLLSVIGYLNLAGLYMGYRRKSVWFKVCAWIAAGFTTAAAMWYANMEYWSRAMYFVVLGFFCIIAPLWADLAGENPNRQLRVAFHVFLATASAVILFSIFGVYIFQQQMWAQTKTDLTSKLSMAVRMTQGAFSTANSVLTTAALNQDLVDAVGKKDLPVIYKYAKVLYESHSYLRRIIVLDAQGNGIALYPYGSFNQTNLSFRDYYIAVRDTHKPYVSSVFDAQSDNTQRPVVSVTVPLLSEKNEFMGALSGSIDLDELNVETQMTADQTKGEAFRMIDAHGRYVLNEDMTKVGQKIQPSDPLLAGINSSPPNTTESFVQNDHLSITAYKALPELGWSIQLRMPMGSVVAIDDIAIIAIIGLILVVLIVGIWAFITLYMRPKHSSRGSP